MSLQTFRLEVPLDAALAARVNDALQGVKGIHRVIAQAGDALFAVDLDDNEEAQQALAAGLARAGFEMGEDPRSEGTCCGGCCGSDKDKAG